MSATRHPVPQKIVVVGAGLVGLAIAWHLGRRGAAVTVIDPQAPGSQCSYGNAGALSPGSVAPIAMPGILRNLPRMLFDRNSGVYVPPRYWWRVLPWLAAFLAQARPDRVESIAARHAPLLLPALDRHRDMAAAIGGSDLLRVVGQLHVYRDDAQFQAAWPVWALRQHYGTEVQRLDRAGIAALEPEVGPDYRLGVFLPRLGHLANPIRYSGLIADAVAQQGGMLLRARVDALLAAQGRVTGVRVGTETIMADAVVVAAGAWSARLLRPLGIRVPMETQRGYHVELPPDSLGIGRIVAPYDAKAFITPMESALRIAGTVEMAGLDAPPSPHRAEVLMAGLVKAFPQLAGQRPLRTWMGHRPCLPDSMPVIGPSARFAGLWFGFGHGHLGVTSSAVTGDVLAAAMLDEVPKLDLGAYALERF